MKRKVALVLVLLLAIGSGFAQDKLTALMEPGAFGLRAGLGWGGVSGGAELMFAQIDIARILPITFGAAARGYVDPGLFWGYFFAGVGGYGTAHIGFSDINLPEQLKFLANVDSYVGLGLSLGFGTGYGSTSMGLGFSTFEGVSYFLNPSFALNLEYGYLGSIGYGGWSFATGGVLLKL